MSHPIRPALVAVAGVAVLGASSPPALAHTEVVSTSPKAGSTVTGAPARVTVTFGGALRTGGGVVVRRGARTVSRGPGGRDRRNVNRLSVDLRGGLAGGRYTVRWRATAADGHRQSGTFRFRVR